MTSSNRKPTQDSPDDLLTVSEVGDVLRVDDTTIRRWIKNGAIDAIVLPHVNERQAYRVKRSTLDAIINGSKLPQ